MSRKVIPVVQSSSVVARWCHSLLFHPQGFFRQAVAVFMVWVMAMSSLPGYATALQAAPQWVTGYRFDSPPLAGAQKSVEAAVTPQQHSELAAVKTQPAFPPVSSNSTKTGPDLALGRNPAAPATRPNLRMAKLL